jgi:hypothetical protein
MSHWTAAAVSAILALGLMGSATAAAKAPAAKAPAAKAPTCSACKMTLSTKKTKAAPKEVKIDGKTYYCCAACKMEAPKKK